MLVLYILFALSVFCPIYTYAIFPIILKLLPGKKYEVSDIEPEATVIICGESEEKIRNINESDYLKLEVLVANDINESVSRAKGEIIVFTDVKTEFDKTAVKNLAKRFADEKVCCIVGQQSNRNDNSAFWKYENKVKELESKIGCVSGANDAILAVRKADMPVVPDGTINIPFYIATSITQSGKHVVFASDAVAYERQAEGDNFQKHVQDGTGYYQALGIFWRMLLPRKGNFVYVGHRVMRWLVPLNMIVALVSSGILEFHSVVMIVLFSCQVIVYVLMLLIGNKKIDGTVGKLSGLVRYFVELNIAYLVGLVRLIIRREEDIK